MEHKQLFRKTSFAERVRFVWLWQRGLSFRAIAKRTETSATTVRRWVRRWQSKFDLRSKKSQVSLQHPLSYRMFADPLKVYQHSSSSPMILQESLLKFRMNGVGYAAVSQNIP